MGLTRSATALAGALIALLVGASASLVTCAEEPRPRSETRSATRVVPVATAATPGAATASPVASGRSLPVEEGRSAAPVRPASPGPEEAPKTRVRVVDEDGAPVADAEVFLARGWLGEPAGGDPEGEAVARTDREGRAGLPVEPGPSTLARTVLARKGGRLGRAPLAPGGRDETTIVVRPLERPAPGRGTLVVEIVALVGGERGGYPEGPVLVQVEGEGGGAKFAVRARRASPGIEGGVVEVRDLPPGAYRVRASAAGFESDPWGGRFDVEADRVTNATARVFRPADLPGVVDEPATLTGTVRTEDGSPAAPARVILLRVADVSWYYAPRDEIDADASGGFEFTGLDAGPYAVQAVDGRGRWSPPVAVDLEPGGLASVELTVAAPGSIAVSIRLDPFEESVLTVQRADGRVFLPDRRSGDRAGPLTDDRRLSGERETRFEGLPAGRYVLHLYPYGTHPFDGLRREVEVRGGQTVPVVFEPEPKGTVNVRLETPFAWEPWGGEPVAFALAPPFHTGLDLHRDVAPWAHRAPLEAGTAALALPPGTYTVAVAGGWTRFYREGVHVQAGGAVEVPLALPAAEQLSALVVEIRDFHPSLSAAVLLEGEGFTSLIDYFQGNQTRRPEGLPPGRARATLLRRDGLVPEPGYEPQEIFLPPGDEARVVFERRRK